mgnify:FL=1
MSLYLITVLTNICLFSFIALSAYLILIVGEVSFGQQAFFGIGAYSLAIFYVYFDFSIIYSILFGMAICFCLASFLSLLTIKLSGLYFAMATLAFAEMFRLSMNLVIFPFEKEGRATGLNGPEGFENIRWIFENNIDPLGFFYITLITLSILVIFLFILERSFIMKHARIVGKDLILAQSLGINPRPYRVFFIGAAGAISGLGGALFALANTYIEPAMFGMMLGVHSLAYTIIGGLGLPVGPLLGVFIDIGLLESIRFLSEYRMIIFGGLVAIILIFCPEGIISPRIASRIKRLFFKKGL